MDQMGSVEVGEGPEEGGICIDGLEAIEAIEAVEANGGQRAISVPQKSGSRGSSDIRVDNMGGHGSVDPVGGVMGGYSGGRVDKVGLGPDKGGLGTDKGAGEGSIGKGSVGKGGPDNSGG